MRLRRLLVVLWVLGTLVLAGRLGATEVTEALIFPTLLDWGIPHMWAYRVHKGLRKAGHVLAYAAFALLMRWALEGVRHRTRWALLAAFLLALLDEGTQALSGERGGSLFDVALDVAAAALALAWVERRAARIRGAGGAGGAEGDGGDGTPAASPPR